MKTYSILFWNNVIYLSQLYIPWILYICFNNFIALISNVTYQHTFLEVGIQTFINRKTLKRWPSTPIKQIFIDSLLSAYDRIWSKMGHTICFTAFYIIIKSKFFPYFQWITFSGCLLRVDTCNCVIASRLNIIYAKYLIVLNESQNACQIIRILM